MRARRAVLTALAVLAVAAPVVAHGGIWQPPPPPPPPTPTPVPRPPPDVRPGQPLPRNGGGLPPGWTPPGESRPPAEEGERGIPPHWHWSRWWALNRESLLGLPALRRSRARARISGTGSPDREEQERLRERRLRSRIVGALLAAAREGDADLATGAIVALGRSRSPLAGPLLANLLAEAGAEPTVRESAALALGLLRLEGAERRSLLTRLLDAKEGAPRERAFAALGLGHLGDRAALPALLRHVRAPADSRFVPAAATLAAGLVRGDGAVAELAAALVGEERMDDPVLRAHAAAALGRMGAEGGLAPLVEALADAAPDVRRQAALSLPLVAGAGDAGALAALSRGLAEDPDPLARAFAAAALGEIGAAGSVREIRKAYRRGDAVLATHAAIALGLAARRADPAAGEPIRSFLRRQLAERPDPDLAGALVVALAAADDGRSAPELRAIVEDGKADAGLRGHAAVSLGILGTVEALPALRSILADTRDPGLLADVACAAGLMADPESREILVALLERGEGDAVRGAAAVSLGRSLSPAAAAALLRILGDAEERAIVRAFAAVGLGHYFEREPVLSGIGDHLNHTMVEGAVAEVLTFF